MTPPNTIIVQKVGVYCQLAPPSAGQVSGATSHVYDWYEYLQESDSTNLLAQVHLYKNPDRSI